MFGIGRRDLIINLENLRSKLCCYSSPNVCDCKFGGRREGEQTGCPEIREVVGLLAIMTKEEFHKLIIKANILLSEEEEND